MSYDNEETDEGGADGAEGDFLDYEGSKGGGGKFLKSWKKRPSKKLHAWLHTKFPPKRVWRHGFVHTVLRKPEGGDEGEEVKRVWTWNLVCHEHEKTLEDQYKRSRETGERESPPEHCAFCKLIEYVHGEVSETMRIVDEAREKGKSAEQVAKLVEGRIGLTTPLFVFEDEVDPKYSKTIHAGGMVGLYTNNLSDYWKKELRRARISLQDAWKEKAVAKLDYLLQLVDDDDAKLGVLKSFETNLVGDKIRSLIKDTQVSLGKEGGNPFRHPYLFEIEHCPNEKEFSKKYAVRRLELVKLRPEVAELIRDTAPHDVSRETRLYSPKELRLQLEAACVYEGLPFDEFFGGAEEPEESEEKPATPKTAKPAAPKAAKPKAPEPDEELVACDECNKPIRISDAKCEHCGCVYREEEPEPAKPEPPRMKTRAEVLAEKEAAKKAEKPKPAAAPRAEKPKPAPEPEPDPDPANGDDADDIPF